ncbi:MAG TPA: hypothetical protein PKA64_09600, partial [Myxococcota bacterium]|nr:hypothetical protein [Myxococcota bacterium]
MSDHAHDACCARDAHHDHAAGATRAWRVEGLDCAEEVATLRRALAPLVPPDHLGFDVLAGRMEVPVDVPASAVEAAVAA